MNGDLSSRLVVGLEGSRLTGNEAAWLAKYQPAGVILFARNIYNYSGLRDLCNALHQLVPGLEIMVDHEGGPVSHLAGALGRPPSAWALGSLDDVALTARVFEETGSRMRKVGIDRVLSPVADVLTEPRNPVIGVRAFGDEEDLVTRHTVAAVTGLLSAGMKVCLKHWPGHGGSSGDSHLAETKVGDGGIPAPFEAGLTAGAGAVMVGHLLLDDGKEEADAEPATLNAEYLDSSRRQLGPGHVEDLLFFADDVTMKALGPAMERRGVAVPNVSGPGLFEPASLPVAWFEQLAGAGCDRILIRGIPAGAFPLDPAEVVSPLPDSAGDPDEEPDFSGGPYSEVRQRIWDRGGADFGCADADLLWLDFSRGDRWEAAADPVGPEGGSVRDGIQSRLASLFGSIHTEVSASVSGKPWNRLLVSSHRPLADAGKVLENIAAKGVCLVMGHPSLQRDLEAVLGRDWVVGALYDITPQDLPEPGTKI